MTTRRELCRRWVAEYDVEMWITTKARALSLEVSIFLPDKNALLTTFLNYYCVVQCGCKVTVCLWGQAMGS